MNKEHMGYRDMKISQRHRQWGLLLPSTDIDFILMERKCNQPVALIDYKHANWEVNLKDNNLICLKTLANMAGLPAFVTIYNEDFTEFIVHALNDEGEFCLNMEVRKFNEYGYIKFMYWLRNEKVPQDIKLQFKNPFIVPVDNPK